MYGWTQRKLCMIENRLRFDWDGRLVALMYFCKEHQKRDKSSHIASVTLIMLPYRQSRH